MKVHELLLRIRTEAERLSGLHPDWSQRRAYEEAITNVVMQQAEALEVDPFEARILDTLDRLSPQDDDPVPTQRLAIELNLEYFTTLYHLKKLEGRYLISRPQGPRSGWKVA